jgi:hypothetical protein
MKLQRWAAAAAASGLIVGGLAGQPLVAQADSTVTAGWEQRLEDITDGVIAKVDETQSQMYDRTKVVTSRALMSVVAHELRDNDDPVAAWDAATLIFDHQSMDPSDEHYGMFTQNLWGNCWYGLRCYQLGVAGQTATTAGSFAQISQTVDVGTGPHELKFHVKDSVTAVQANYHKVQALIDGVVVWERDASGGTVDWEYVTLNVDAALQGKAQATLSFRLYQSRAVSNFPVKVSIDTTQLSGTNLDPDMDDPTVWSTSSGGTGVTVDQVTNGSTEINSTSFTLLMWAGIVNSPDFMLFTAAQRAEILDRVTAASYFTIDEPHAQVAYTNARLIRDIQMILIGQAVGDTDLYDQGVEYWEEWLDYTRDWGIREYGSTVYYGVDLGALMMGYGYVSDSALRAEFGKALDFFWYDIAANYLPARETIAGSSSREYDWTHNSGPMYFLRIEGWRTQELPSYTTFNYQVVLAYSGANVYHPSQPHWDLATTTPKTVEALTDPNRFLDRYAYITDGWALGSTSDSFTNVIPGFGGPTPYDKGINATLVDDDPGIGTLGIIPSVGTDPYGKSYTGSAPLHAPLFPVTVQSEGNLLTQLDLNPSGQRTTSFTTNLLIPADADLVLVDGTAVDTTTVGTSPAAVTSTITMRVGESCAAYRILRADGIDGHTPSAAFVVDSSGLDIGMSRFTITQYDVPTRTAMVADRAAVTVYMRLGSCIDDTAASAFAQATKTANISQQQSSTVHSSAVTTPEGSLLQVGTDLVDRDPLFRKVNGVASAAPSILTVNGVDYSGALD